VREPTARENLHACPLSVRGARVTARNVTGGVELVFSTTGTIDDVDDLRARIRVMATHLTMGRMTGAGGGMGQGGWAGEWSREAEILAGTPVPAVTRWVESTPDGARVVLRPVDRADLDRVRARTLLHASVMGSGRCAQPPGG